MTSTAATLARLAAVTLSAWLGGLPTAFAAEPAFRYIAPIDIRQAAPFVQMSLTPEAYGRTAQPDLRDLRVVDANGQRVPFALLGARSEAQVLERLHGAVLYPLPERPAADGHWQAPVEVVVDGDRITVRKAGGRRLAGGMTTPEQSGSSTNGQPTPRSPAGAIAVASGPSRSAGWLIDAGERRPGEPAPASLKMRWSGPAEFSAGYRFETSDDLRGWRAGGSGQLMALAPLAAGLVPLTQATVALPTGAGRFVRLFWLDAAAAPQVTGAEAVVPERAEVAIDAPTEIVLEPTATPADSATTASDAKGALYFDLGGVLPLSKVDLRLGDGTRVAPVRLQGRASIAQPWRDIGQGVFYRLERDGAVSTSPPLTVNQSARFVRVVPDERAAPLAAATTRLAVQAQLASLVFAVQGQPPFRLQAGSADAAAGSLPATTLVPGLEAERPRFGRAVLGAWSEVGAVARDLDAAQRQARWRPWLLWAVLVIGVAGLGFMVWRLTRVPLASADG